MMIGSCRAAGYETCCTDGACIGEPSSALCYCDETCEIFQDCCDDYYEICRGEYTKTVNIVKFHFTSHF